MTSAVICVDTPFPTFNDIMESLKDALPDLPMGPPGFSITLPQLPHFPSPIPWPTFNTLHAYLEQFVMGLCNFQLVSVISAAYDTLASIFSLPFPDIPGLPGINFADILAGNIKKITDAVIEAMGDVFDLSFLPSIPTPFFPTFNFHIQATLSAIQVTINAYMYDMANLLFEMVNEVADILKLPAMSAIPVMPTIDEILAMLPDMPTLNDLKNLVFAAFGGLMISLPDPLIPGFNIPEFDFVEGIKALYNDMANYAIKLITDFITDVLSLGLVLPTICLPFTLLSA